MVFTFTFRRKKKHSADIFRRRKILLGQRSTKNDLHFLVKSVYSTKICNKKIEQNIICANSLLRELFSNLGDE